MTKRKQRAPTVTVIPTEFKCVKCGRPNTTTETLYVDARTTGVIDGYRVVCGDCGLIFELNA